MDDYGINDALVELDVLENENVGQEDRVGIIDRVRTLLRSLERRSVEIEQASVLIGDDR